MDEEEVFSFDELNEYVTELVRIIRKNSPKRDDDSYPRVIKSHGVIISPYPGNLKQNGNQIVNTAKGFKVKHGYEPARYALYANKRSRKPKYIEKSITEFARLMESKNWERK